MPTFTITDVNLSQNIFGLIEPNLKCGEFSLMCLFDLKSSRFKLSICDTEIQINKETGEFEGAMKGIRLLSGKEWIMMFNKLREKRKAPLQYHKNGVITSEEIFLEAYARSKRISSFLSPEWVAFFVNYNANPKKGIVFSALHCSIVTMSKNMDFGRRFDQIKIHIESAFKDFKQRQNNYYPKLSPVYDEEQKLAPNPPSFVQQFSIPYDKKENFLRDFIANKTLSIQAKINIINLQRAQIDNGGRNIAQMHADMEMLRLTDIELFNQGKEIHAHLCKLVEELLPKNIRTVKVKPEDLECSITLNQIQNPVVAMDGVVYEQKSIEDWFDKSSRFPNSEEVLTDKIIITFQLMKKVLCDPEHKITEHDLICPLTHKFMDDPVLATNGLLYERIAIEEEFRKNPNYLSSDKLVSVRWVNAIKHELLNIVTDQSKKTTHAFLMQNLSREEKGYPPLPATPAPLPVITIFKGKSAPVDLRSLFEVSSRVPLSPGADVNNHKPPALRKG